MYLSFAIMVAVAFATALVATPLVQDFAKKPRLGYICGAVIGGVLITVAHVLQNESVSRTELMVTGAIVYVVTLLIASRIRSKRDKNPPEKK